MNDEHTILQRFDVFKEELFKECDGLNENDIASLCEKRLKEFMQSIRNDYTDEDINKVCAEKKTNLNDPLGFFIMSKLFNKQFLK